MVKLIKSLILFAILVVLNFSLSGCYLDECENRFGTSKFLTDFIKDQGLENSYLHTGIPDESLIEVLDAYELEPFSVTNLDYNILVGEKNDLLSFYFITHCDRYEIKTIDSQMPSITSLEGIISQFEIDNDSIINIYSGNINAFFVTSFYDKNHLLENEIIIEKSFDLIFAFGYLRMGDVSTNIYIGEDVETGLVEVFYFMEDNYEVLYQNE